jgi:hypothetical protein
MPARSKALQIVLKEAQGRAMQLPLDRREKLYLGLAELCAYTQQRA